MTLASILAAADLRDVRVDNDVPAAAAHARHVAPGGLARLLRSAEPIRADDATVDAWAYAPWSRGSFTTKDGTYGFSLFLGGRGLLTTRAGTQGFFSFDTGAATAPATAGR
ncbi:MAG TPA: hypothetical protein VF796_08275 [Humisphaera sp.]